MITLRCTRKNASNIATADDDNELASRIEYGVTFAIQSKQEKSFNYVVTFLTASEYNELQVGQTYVLTELATTEPGKPMPIRGTKKSKK